MLERVGRKGALLQCWWNVLISWNNQYGDQYGGSWKKLNTDVPYDPEILLSLSLYVCMYVCIYIYIYIYIYISPEKNTICKDTCTAMFIAVLFTKVKTWKQPKYPLTEEWIKTWYIYTMEYYSAIERTKWCHLQQHGIDLEIIILSEVRQIQISYEIMQELPRWLRR